MKLAKILATVCFICLGFAISAQTDTTQTETPPAQEPVEQPTEKTKQAKGERTSYNRFKVYVGGTFSDLLIDETYDSEGRLGFTFGGAYQQGRYFYWEIGGAFNKSYVNLSPDQNMTEDNLGVSSIDVPISLGLNILGFSDRLVGLRAFVGATPSFVIDVNDNDYNIDKDDLNSLLAYGHAGVGVNVAFIYLEAVFKYGFVDLFEELDSEPWQLHVNLGFRF